MSEVSPYLLRIDLSTLKHLGIGLYSNMPAPLSELVANAYDADASEVRIDLKSQPGMIAIQDDGTGMTLDDINNRFLNVGYEKRKADPGPTLKYGRQPMGRKGIGKLSMFSIADTIVVKTSRATAAGVHKHAFRMTAEDLRQAIENGIDYRPVELPADVVDLDQGTRIELSDLKRTPSAATTSALRQRLARRFSIIGQAFHFEVLVDGESIGVQDREYYRKVEFLWPVGSADADKYKEACGAAEVIEVLPAEVNPEEGLTIRGWIGTVARQDQLAQDDNAITVLARGKLIHENLLAGMKEAGVYAAYLIGELDAEFLDRDDADDIATSDRQSVREDDPRFTDLREFVQTQLLKPIQAKWRELRKSKAKEKALQNPAVREWFDHLRQSTRSTAEKLFETIERSPIEDDEQRKELYKHTILAFETLAVKDKLDLLASVESSTHLAQLSAIFGDIDALEEVHYYHIARGRLGVLEKFEQLVDANAKERLIQEHVFSHLWLLDPSWDRASTDARMEQSVMAEFKTLDAKLNKEERQARLDIRYRTAAGKHIIVELKKYGVKTNAFDLSKQVDKYVSALEKVARRSSPNSTPVIEAICIVGHEPSPDPQKASDLLRQVRARYVTYDQLIQQTRDSYRDYIEKQPEIKRIRDLIDKL